MKSKSGQGSEHSPSSRKKWRGEKERDDASEAMKGRVSEPVGLQRTEEGICGGNGRELYLSESPWQAPPLIKSPKEEDTGSAASLLLPAAGSLREWWSLPGGNAGESRVR